MDHRVDPIATRSRALGKKRLALEAEQAELQRRVEDIDRRIDGLRAERTTLTRRRSDIEATLAPTWSARGRRPQPDGSVALPAVAEDAVRLYGRRLRSTCLTLLEERGPLSLIELHSLLHLRGYVVDHAHPVQALSAALAYETDRGRATRRARGVYERAPKRPPRPAAAADRSPSSWS